MRTVVVAENPVVAECAALDFKERGHDAIQIVLMRPQAECGRAFLFEDLGPGDAMPRYAAFDAPGGPVTLRLDDVGKVVPVGGSNETGVRWLRQAQIVALCTEHDGGQRAVALSAYGLLKMLASNADVVFQEVRLIGRRSRGLQTCLIRDGLSISEVENGARFTRIYDFLVFNFQRRARLGLRAACDHVGLIGAGNVVPDLFSIHAMRGISNSELLTRRFTSAEFHHVVGDLSAGLRGGWTSLGEQSRHRIILNLEESGLLRRDGELFGVTPAARVFMAQLHPQAIDPAMQGLLNDWMESETSTACAAITRYLDAWFERQREFAASRKAL